MTDEASVRIPETAFGESDRVLVMTVLSLTVAAGGEIIVRDKDMVEIGNYRLIVTQDRFTGDKTYRAVLTFDENEPLPTDTPTSKE
ncbi:hypothetical protein [Hyphomicrobium sp. DMF-1]|uniref:hypothetical protein n=1 Tax=Hyphomicrobium sp. DMF-1 TaxID=3019544 RepID=UPI0022EBDBC2|nr:hypothetical protein [Hyphomicrobium sp. DMF-1]WBT40184.1 hypothetical protein PE058_09960 [Hyphomicrobium sp. DMF-1]